MVVPSECPTRFTRSTPYSARSWSTRASTPAGAAAIAAGLLLGLLEVGTMSQLPSAYKEVVSIVVLLLILVVRPSGLFARRETSALRAF